jgi:hypothetical protein
MISGDFVYHGMNTLLAIVALLSIFLLPKLFSDSGARRKLIGSFALLILTGVIFSLCLKYFRLLPFVYAGAGLGKINPLALTVVDSLKYVVVAGNVLEFLAVLMLASVTRSLLKSTGAGEAGREGA